MLVHHITFQLCMCTLDSRDTKLRVIMDKHVDKHITDTSVKVVRMQHAMAKAKTVHGYRDPES